MMMMMIRIMTLGIATEEDVKKACEESRSAEQHPCNKCKVDKSDNMLNLVDEDINLFPDSIVEVAKSSFKGISKK